MTCILLWGARNMANVCQQRQLYIYLSEFQFFVLSLSILLNNRAPHGSVIRNRFTLETIGAVAARKEMVSESCQTSWATAETRGFRGFLLISHENEFAAAKLVSSQHSTKNAYWGQSWDWVSAATNTSSRNGCWEIINLSVITKLRATGLVVPKT